MTHTSTGQPESVEARALRLVLWLDKLSNGKFGNAAEAARLIESLHARVQELEAIRKAACKAYNRWAYAEDTYGEVTQAMRGLADAISGITQEKQG